MIAAEMTGRDPARMFLVAMLISFGAGNVQIISKLYKLFQTAQHHERFLEPLLPKSGLSNCRLTSVVMAWHGFFSEDSQEPLSSTLKG